MIIKSKAALCTVLAASLLTGPFALAQGDAPGARFYEQHQRSNERDRRDDGQRHRRQDNQHSHGNNEWRGNEWRGRDHRADRYHHRGERGAGPNYSYYRGSYLPPQYRTRQYVVEDWRGHRLSAPPRGHYWVQSGSDYLLVAIATGVVVALLLNN